MSKINELRTQRAKTWEQASFFGIHSPSTEMAWVGKMLVEGLSGSIEDNGDEAVKAAEDMAEDINDVMQGLADDMQTSLPTDFSVSGNASATVTGGANNSAAGYGALITVQQMIVRSEEDIRRISQELYNLIQSGSRAQGRFSTA